MDLYLDNDNALTLVGLQNSVSAAYLNSATVTVTLTDSDGAEITGETWPLSMAYVAASDGNYRATLADDLSGMAAEDAITAEIIADGGTGLKGTWQVALTAKTRTA